MAVAFRSKSYANGGAVTSVTPAEPSGAAQDDVLLYWHNVNANTGMTGGPSGGWTLLYRWVGSVTGGFTTSLYWIRRGSSAPGFQSPVSGSSTAHEASVSCWSGCETNGWPFSQCKFNGSPDQLRSNPDCPSLNTIVDNTIVVALAFDQDGASTTWTMPTGYSVVEDQTGSSSAKRLAVGYKSVGTAATEDPGAFSGSAAGTDMCHEATVALMPAQTGYPNFRSMTHMDDGVDVTITPAEPSGATQNDFLVYWLVSAIGQTFSSGPSGGWTLLNTWSNTNTVTRLYVLRRGASAPGYTATFTSNNYLEALVTCWSGVKTTGNGYGATTFGAPRSANPADTGSVTTTGDKSLVLSMAMQWTGTFQSNNFWATMTGYADASNASYCLDQGGNQNTNPDLGAFFKRVATSGTAEDPGAFSPPQTANDTAEATVELLAGPTSVTHARQVLIMGSGM